MHPAMFLRGSQARFTDPSSGELVQPGNLATPRSVAQLCRQPSTRLPVFPNILQRQLETAVDVTLKALLGKRRSRDVAAKSLELGAVVPVNALLGVDADAERFGDRLLFGLAAPVLAGGLARGSAKGHAQHRLPRALAGDGNAVVSCS
jgi:hypothetical protein